MSNRNEYQRNYYKANTERVLEINRKWRQNNREKYNASHRNWSARNGLRKRHGPLVYEWWAETWARQSGACCYCLEPFTSTDVIHIDHDHRCCPPKASCSNCRRGLAHNNCNIVVGMGKENPDRIHQIAKSLEKILSAQRGVSIELIPLF